MNVLLALLVWLVCGWVCAYFSTPKWMRWEVGWLFMLLVCGAIVGPFGVFWFWFKGDFHEPR